MTVDKQKQPGFTIVELLIVVVVIAILAAITVVAFTGVQERARDAKRVSDLNTLVKSMNIWAIQTGNRPIDNGSNNSGTGYGWVYASYPVTIEGLLMDAGLLSSGVRDPVNPTGTGSYMFYPCKFNDGNTRYGFFARLELPDRAASNDLARWQSEGCTSVPINTYGMNYARTFVY